MAWSALFDHTHIVKGVPLDADIELQCRKCKILFFTKNAFYIGYSTIHYANPALILSELSKLFGTKQSGPTGMFY